MILQDNAIILLLKLPQKIEKIDQNNLLLLVTNPACCLLSHIDVTL